jgi:hypothetical protein
MRLTRNEPGAFFFLMSTTSSEHTPEDTRRDNLRRYLIVARGVHDRLRAKRSEPHKTVGCGQVGANAPKRSASGEVADSDSVRHDSGEGLNVIHDEIT